MQDKSFNGFLNWILDLRIKLNIPHKLSEVIPKKDFNIEANQHNEIPEALIIDKHQNLNQNPLFLKGFFEISGFVNNALAGLIRIFLLLQH